MKAIKKSNIKWYHNGFLIGLIGLPTVVAPAMIMINLVLPVMTDASAPEDWQKHMPNSGKVVTVNRTETRQR